MPAFPSRTTRLAAALTAVLAATGCGTVDKVSYGITDAITPYKVEVVQGNFVSKEQVDALKPGMSRQQVREILGTPLVTSLFHAGRWDYVFTLKRKGSPFQERRLTVFFKDDSLDKFEGDPMPTEAEFVASLDNKRKGAVVPPLEASEDALKKFAAERGPAAPPPPAEPPVSASYPPLETPAR
jgi:outer membrane protein assembly factor BamE